MAELTPLTEADLDTYNSLIGEHGALAPIPARHLIAELRALREAASPFAMECQGLGAEILQDADLLHCKLPVRDYRQIRRLLPPPPVVALDGSGERG